MADTILITASLRMEAPPDVVRAQYRDIDHHIRNDVHPSIHYQWEPSAPGERKIRTTFHILGVPQYDVSLLEDAPDGSFVIRYLEGTNAGMILVHEFVPLDDGRATEVRLRADAPATLARKLLGPLFTFGARQVMKKALYEDKRDLEKGAYREGRAAGDLARAFAPLEGVRRRGDVSVAHAIVSAACALASVDGTLDPAERDALRSLATELRVDGGWLAEAERSQLSAAAATATRIEHFGAALAASGAVREGLTAAAVVGLVSHGMSLGELQALRLMARSAGFDETELEPLVESCDQALMATA